MKVLETELEIEHLEAFRWLVKSRSRPDRSFLVDLECNETRGQCDCEDFRIRCQAKINEGATGEVTTCAHLRAVQRVYTEWTVKKVIEMRGHE